MAGSAQALMSIPAIQGRGHRPGAGCGVATLPGLAHSRRNPAAHRRLCTIRSGIALSRPTNNAGGLEGGITNGEDVRVTAYMKPIATLMKPLRSGRSHHDGGEPGGRRGAATSARCPAAAPSSVKRWWPSSSRTPLIEKFGGDSLEEMLENWRAFSTRTNGRPVRSTVASRHSGAFPRR